MEANLTEEPLLPIVLTLEDIKCYDEQPEILDQKYPASFPTDMPKSHTPPTTENNQGQRIRVVNFAKPFGYLEIITHFLHRWIPDAEEKLNEVTKVLNNEADLEQFLHSLKKMYLYYYHLVRDTYSKHQDEIDTHTTSEWYQTMLSYFSAYGEDVTQIFDQAQCIPDSCRDGLLIDIEAYRGTGLFLVVLDPQYYSVYQSGVPLSAYKVLPTLGDYGHLLPEPGFSMVLRHGLSFFRDTEISGYQISHLRKIKKRIPGGEYIPMQYSKPIYLETSWYFELDNGEMDEVMVDGVAFFGFLTENYV